MIKPFTPSLVALLVLLSVAGEAFDIGSLIKKYETALKNEIQSSDEVRKIPSFSSLKTDEKREIFHYEKTIVIRDSKTADDKVQRCELVSVSNNVEKVEVLSELKKVLNLDVKEVLMDKMMNLIKDCDSVDDNTSNKETTPEPESSEEVKPSLHVIVPGTKWCGTGNIAKSYQDLGKQRDVDRCCRSHDMCPISIPARGDMYNVTNSAIYTTSHCLCDEGLYECLKKDNGLTAKITGELYFNVLRTKCIVGLPENTNEKMKIIPATRHW